jgi:transcriptional regulator with XRE-family HTH domain
MVKTFDFSIIMTFGERITYARKQKKMTQSDLGRVVGTSGDNIGKYERGEIKPSIDTAAKIVEALNATIYYLVKDAEYQNIDYETLKRMKGLEKLSKEEKGPVFAMLDAFFAEAKLQSIL